MASDPLDPGVARRLSGLRKLQSEFGAEIADVTRESPAVALASLEEAIAAAPADYGAYLEEALACYSRGLYRAAILLVWSGVMEHLYRCAGARRGGVAAFEEANRTRFGASKKYHQIRKQDDFLYLGERDYIQLGEDAGMFNRNARSLLHEKLKLRNLCGHPTGYTPGREETVVFIESLVLNIMSGSWLNW
jgi:hypothetical protein